MGSYPTRATNTMKLKETNNWENLSYTLGDRNFTMQDRFVEIKLSNKWQKFEIDWRQKHFTVSDMGNQYSGSTLQPWVTIEYKGIKIPVELMTFAKKEMRQCN